MAQINKERTESGRKNKRTEYGLRETENVLFHLSVDLYRYSTVLYAVYICISKVSKAHLIHFVDQNLWKCYTLSCLECANTC